MKLSKFAAAALIGLTATAGVASAAPLNYPMLARNGIDASQYSDSEARQINTALRNGDVTTARYYINHEDRAVEHPADVNPGTAQLAAQLGLNPGNYTTGELEAVSTALRSDNMQNVAFVEAHDNRMVPGAKGVVTPGKAQIAAQLGVNPADYTDAQLNLMMSNVVGNGDSGLITAQHNYK
ncbi:hypothetical protein [Thioclava sp. GXIMD2076]|uniref:Uncharacterized protein n=1 Tax=Thioclava kandeliae TaxID=3070818 RepID=A0ABV1SG38_9RHOB